MSHRLFDDEESHLTPVLPSMRLVLTIAAVVYLVILVWLWLTIDDANVGVLLTGAVLFSGASALLAGNTYRLLDLRRRRVVQSRADKSQRSALVSKLTPKETIRFRFGAAGTGLALAMVALLGAMVIIDADERAEAVVVSFLMLGMCLACLVAGTLARPLD